MSRTTPTHCDECARPFRARGTAEANHPGTVFHAGRGLCNRCYIRAKRAGQLHGHQLTRTATDTPKTCAHCQRPTRPHGIQATDLADTVLYGAAGLCVTCYRDQLDSPHEQLQRARSLQAKAARDAAKAEAAEARRAARGRDRIPVTVHGHHDPSPIVRDLAAWLDAYLTDRRHRGIPPQGLPGTPAVTR